MNEALDIQWNNQCIGQPATVDITLISTSLSTNASLIAKFLSVDFSAGEYSVSDCVSRRPPAAVTWHLPPVPP
jgi:hypothetical protein